MWLWEGGNRQVFIITKFVKFLPTLVKGFPRHFSTKF